MDGQMRQHDARQGFIGGAILVALGAHFLFRQVFDFDLGRYGWPLFIIGPGVLLFAGMVASGRGAGSMAIPASIVTTIGLLLFVQNATGYFESWAYAWALIPLAAGLGTCIAGAWDGNAKLVAEGQRGIMLGAALFLGFAAFFEGFVFHGFFLASYLLPVALILGGVAILVRNIVRARRAALPNYDDVTEADAQGSSQETWPL